MSKIKNIIALADLPLRLLAQLDDYLIDLFYQFDGGLDDLESYLTEKRFIIANIGKDDFYILDCDELQLEDYDLSDPKNLIENADSFTIKDYQKLLSGNVMISSVQEKIAELLEVPYDLQIFGGVVIK